MKITEFLRALTRPIISIIFAATIAQVVIEKIDTPEWFLPLASATILWYFGDRTYQRVKEAKQVKEDK